MSQLQKVYDRIKEAKVAQKEIKDAYKNELDNNPEYQSVKDKLKDLKDKKKTIEEEIKAEMKSSFDKLDDLKIDIESDQEMLNDIAINQLMSGKTVEVVDENEQKYYPVFSVKFKKEQ